MKAAFWQVQPKHLDALDAGNAVDVLRELLCSEAGRLGISLTSVDVPSALTTKDGGIDGEVRRVPENDGDLLFEGITRYQVKTGSFSLAKSEKGLKEVLLRPNPRKKKGNYAVTDIQPRVRDCLDREGTLVVASFGDDLVHVDAKSVEVKIREFLAKIDPKYADAKVKVWTRNQLRSLINRVPGLALRLRGNDDMPVELFNKWQKWPSLGHPLKLGAPQSDLIDTVRTQLQAVHYRTPIRILGEAGIGKTRLVLEALRDETLAPLVLYTDRPRSLIDRLARLTSQADDIEAILVVDECSPQERYIIVDRLAPFAPAIRVITIYQEETEAESGALLAVQPLPKDQITQILQSYGAPEVDLPIWTEACEGSPRLAHLIGENLRSDPNNPFMNRDQLLDHTIAGNTTIGTPQFDQRKLVLSSLALFKRFGFLHPVDSEFEAIYKHIICPLDHTLSKNGCKQIIRSVMKRRILQGESTLYITPRLLHVWLWTEWWRIHGSPDMLRRLLACLPAKLQQWLGEMMQYAQESQRFLGAARSLFQPGGPLHDLEGLETGANSRFFFHLSLAIPDIALHWLEKSFDQLSSCQLGRIETPRREIVPALQRIAMDAEYFERAARLLARLAVAENERWSNNASGVFAELFLLGRGQVASSAAPPEDRLPILLDLLKSNQPEERKLALEALDTGLRTSFTRTADLDQQGLRRRKNLWFPKTYEELYGAYRTYWHAVRSHLGNLIGNERTEAARVLLRHARSLVPIMPEEIIATLEQLRTKQIIDDREIIHVVEDILRYSDDKLPSGVKAKLVESRNRLVGDDFAALMRRYVGMELIHDHFDQDNKHIQGPHPRVIQLAELATKDRGALKRELSWLVTPDAANGFAFGRALADRDSAAFPIWPEIRDAWLEAGRDASDFFIGGYLSGVYQRDPSEWEKAIVRLLHSTAPKQLVVSTVWRSGMTERVGQAILALARSGDIPPETLETFSFGGAWNTLPVDVFEDWISFLVSQGSHEAVKAALTLTSFRAHNQAIDLSEELVRELLFHKVFFGKAPEGRWDTMVEHNWFELAKRWSGNDENKLLEGGSAILRGISVHSSIFSYMSDDARQFLVRVIAADPETLWRAVANLIHPRRKDTDYGLTELLQGGNFIGDQDEGILNSFPPSLVLEWVAEDAEVRAKHIVHFVPKDVTPEKWPGSLWRELLVLYGDQRSVRSALQANYFTEGYAGPGSSHQTEKIRELEDIFTNETDSRARAWLKEMILLRQRTFKREIVEEEREW